MAAPAIGMETTGTVTGTRVGVSSAALLPTGLTVGLMVEVLVEAAVETREVHLPEAALPPRTEKEAGLAAVIVLSPAVLKTDPPAVRHHPQTESAVVHGNAVPFVKVVSWKMLGTSFKSKLTLGLVTRGIKKTN